jgi:heme oxygenase
MKAMGVPSDAIANQACDCTQSLEKAIGDLPTVAESFSKAIKAFNSRERYLARLEAQLLHNEALKQQLADVAQRQSEAQNRQIVLEGAFDKSRDRLDCSETRTAAARGGARQVPQSGNSNRINAV